MALRTATVIKVISDANPPPAKTTLDGDVGDAIDAVAGTRALSGFETAVISLDAVINGRTDPVEIIQSAGNLSLDDVMLTLGEKGYRSAWKPKKSGRVGGQDRVVITIAWNT